MVIIGKKLLEKQQEMFNTPKKIYSNLIMIFVYFALLNSNELIIINCSIHLSRLRCSNNNYVPWKQNFRTYLKYRPACSW